MWSAPKKLCVMWMCWWCERLQGRSHKFRRSLVQHVQDFHNYSRRFHSVWYQRLQFADPPVCQCACVVFAVSSGSRRLSFVICCVQHVRQLFLRLPDAAAHLLPALLCLLLPWRPKLPRGELCDSFMNKIEQISLIFRIKFY